GKTMEDYFAYISEWIGLGAITPIIYLFSLAGPFAILFLAELGDDASERVKVIIAICSFFASFFLFVGTALYLMKPLGLPGKGFIEAAIGCIAWWAAVQLFANVMDSLQRRKEADGE